MNSTTLPIRMVGRTTALLPALLLALASPAVYADGLADQVAGALKSGKNTWLAWTVPSAADGVACCWNGKDKGGPQSCSLSTESHGLNTSRDGVIDPNLMVYAHFKSGRLDAVRVFSSSCRVDRGNETVQELTGVNPSESVSYLDSLIKGGDEDRASKRRRDGALMALALHDDTSADAVLERVAKDNPTKSLRHSAAFWLGNTREQPGYEALQRLRASGDASFREHLTFAFSQSPVPEAQGAVIDMARNDPSSKVRGQALFWIAQKAQKRADADVIRTAVDDPDEDVKKKAVFALSQIPGGEGVPDLIRVAKENKNRAVRKQAMFWLGQSKDPRALAFFETVLSR